MKMVYRNNTLNNGLKSRNGVESGPFFLPIFRDTIDN